MKTYLKRKKIIKLPEIIMYYNVYDKRFYIYKGENYLFSTKNPKKAMIKYFNYCTSLLKELKTLKKLKTNNR